LQKNDFFEKTILKKIIHVFLVILIKLYIRDFINFNDLDICCQNHYSPTSFSRPLFVKK